jgi:phage-related protein
VAFEIEEGYVEVTARVDRSSLAKAAKEAGQEAGREMEKGTREEFGRSSRRNSRKNSSILVEMFKPDPQVFNALRAPFSAAFSTPVSAAVLAVAATASILFIGAMVAALTPAALGGVFIGLGIAAIKENKKVVSEFEKTAAQIKKTFQEAAAPLIEPVVQSLGIFRNTMKDLAPEFRQVFDTLSQAVVPLAQGVSDFVEAFMQALTQDPAALEGMRDVLIAIGENLPKLGTALGEFFAMLAKNDVNVANIGRLFDVLSGAVTGLGYALVGISQYFDYLIEFWKVLINAGGAAVDWITGTAVPALVGAFNSVVGFFQSIPGWISGAWAAVVGFFSGLWNTVSTTVANVVGAVVGFFASLPGRVMAAIAALPGLVIGFFSDMLNRAAYAVGFLLGTIVEFFINLPGRVVSAITSLPGLVAGIVSDLWNRATALVSSGVSAVVGFFASLPGRAASALTAIIGRITSIFSSARSAATNAASSLVTRVIQTLAQLPGRAASALSSFASRVASTLRQAVNSAYQIGRDIVSGVIRGMASMGGALIARARDLANRAKQGFKDALGISSPSRVFMELGVNTLEGLIRGLTQTDGVERAMDHLTRAVVGGAGFSAASPVVSAAPVSGGLATAPALPSPPSSSAASMTPSFDVRVYVGDREIRDVVRVEINEHDRSLRNRVAAGTGAWNL